MGDELVGRRAGREARHHRRPLPQHRDPVADAADLVEPVRDVDDADALGGEPADHVEERLDLALVEDGGGLVHDEQAHVVGQRPGDRHDLLAGRPEVAHPGVGGDRLVADALEQGGGLAAHAGPVEEPALAELVAEEDVVGDPEVGDQVELLVDRGDAAADGRRRVAAGERLAVEQDLAVGRVDGAGDALDQRGLAGAVGADDAVHLAGPHVEVDAVEGAHAGVLLGQAPDLEERRRRPSGHQQGSEGGVGDPQADLDLLLGAAPHRVFVLDGQHAVEAALVEGVDEPVPVDLAAARARGSATSRRPTGRRAARRGRATRTGCGRRGRARCPWPGRGGCGRRRASPPRRGRSPSRAGGTGRS